MKPGWRRAGCVEDFEQFAGDAMPMLYRLARSISRDERRAEDLMQVTMERMWAAWPRLGNVDDRYAYARRVLINAHHAERRSSWWRRERVVQVEHLELFATPGDDLLGRVDQLALLAGLTTLPERQRVAVVLRHLEGLSTAETAALMNCSTGNVKRLTHDGLRGLRGLMTDHEPLPERTP